MIVSAIDGTYASDGTNIEPFRSVGSFQEPMITPDAQAIVSAIDALPARFADLLKQRDRDAKAAYDYVKNVGLELQSASSALKVAAEQFRKLGATLNAVKHAAELCQGRIEGEVFKSALNQFRQTESLLITARKTYEAHLKAQKVADELLQTQGT